jgi:hypothetical protein
MSTGGWITMILSVGFVVAMFSWSMGKVLFGKEPSEKLHSLDSIDTHDTNGDGDGEGN